jgi:hypothetical protein
MRQRSMYLKAQLNTDVLSMLHLCHQPVPTPRPSHAKAPDRPAPLLHLSNPHQRSQIIRLRIPTAHCVHTDTQRSTSHSTVAVILDTCIPNWTSSNWTSCASTSLYSGIVARVPILVEADAITSFLSGADAIRCRCAVVGSAQTVIRTVGITHVARAYTIDALESVLAPVAALSTIP